MSLKENYYRVKEGIARSAGKSGRDPEDITLVAVSKTVSVDEMLKLYDLGHTVFGENRVEEASRKVSALPSQIKLHMIGHLQSRKAKNAVSIFDMIESVDSARLAGEIGKRCVAEGLIRDILIEVNTSGEPQKYGFSHVSLRNSIDEIVSLKGIKVCGLMVMAPFVSNPEDVRPVFRKTKEFFDELSHSYPMRYLSMGMSQDYEVAVEEGANIVRVGSAIFRSDR